MSQGETCADCGCAQGHHLYNCPALTRIVLADDEHTIRRMAGAYSFLNNFHPARVHLDGEAYPTVENAFQAAKTHDPGARAPFRACAAAEAKRLGTRLALRPDWQSVKLAVMSALVAEKFSEPGLYARLQATAPRALVEGNWWHDNFWGSCHCARCAGRGLNHLGRILMSLRDATPDGDGSAPTST